MQKPSRAESQEAQIKILKNTGAHTYVAFAFGFPLLEIHHTVPILWQPLFRVAQFSDSKQQVRCKHRLCLVNCFAPSNQQPTKFFPNVGTGANCKPFPTVPGKGLRQRSPFAISTWRHPNYLKHAAELRTDHKWLVMKCEEFATNVTVEFQVSPALDMSWHGKRFLAI